LDTQRLASVDSKTPASPVDKNRGAFLVRKCVFLLTSSVGQAMAENLVDAALKQIRVPHDNLNTSDIQPLSAQLRRGLSPFVGDEKAERLTSALRVLVGGVVQQ